MTPDQFRAIQEKVDDIHSALIGNPITQDGGMVRRVDKIEHTVNELKRFKDRSKWTATLLIGVAGMFGWLADKFISLFTSNH